MRPRASGVFTTGQSWTNAALPGHGTKARPKDSRICRDTFFSYDELNGRLDELNDMFNDRPRKNKTYSRREQYEREERPYMLPLPPKPFLLKYTKEITINSTYHFQVDRNHFYSVSI